jgi:uncharacterized membrane protein
MSKTRDRVRKVGQFALGAVLLTTGTAHMTFQRDEFQAQVPDWVPIGDDAVVLLSGVVELTLGAALVATWKQPARAVVGGATAAFFVAIFPGNIAQLTNHVDAFGLDTDTKRAIRLLFQPLLVAWAIEASDARAQLRAARA